MKVFAILALAVMAVSAQPGPDGMDMNPEDLMMIMEKIQPLLEALEIASEEVQGICPMAK